MRRTWVKMVCALLLVVSLLAGAAGTVVSVAWYYDEGVDGSFYDSSPCWQVTNEKRETLWRLINVYRQGEDGYSTSYIENLRAELDPENTNFRYVGCDETGAVIFGHPDMEKDVYRTYDFDSYTVEVYNQELGVYEEVEYAVYWGVADPLTVDDEYMEAQRAFDWMNANVNAVLVVSIGLLILALVLLILLIRFAGRRRGVEGVVLNWQDKIPSDLYLVASVALIVLGCVIFAEGAWYLDMWDYAEPFGWFWLGASALAVVVLALALILTAATRIKARTVFRNTVIYRLGGWLWRKGKIISEALPLIWKAAIVGGGYLLVSILLLAPRGYWFDRSGFFFALWLVMTLALVAYLLWWAWQWKQVRLGTQKIIGGDPEHHIESGLLPPDLKSHADELNSLGGAISTAVEQRLTSERFKTELITNVSHDLKTPLTSIINYVDLLKKEEIGNPTAVEYIEVLDRKSQRLKKLTEDLVEASKASTGALAVERERLDVTQLVRQAVGEYEEKLTAAGLTAVVTLPDAPIHIHADGRHVWRVLDNLLGNCAKYALAGTRVYVDAALREGKAVITVKNISRNPLNIPAEQLMDRFVRGDESRTTEGSGLGLSIARSLTELQEGRFFLDIDGDLFKAVIEFPVIIENG